MKAERSAGGCRSQQPVDAALAYAGLGHSVFPLRSKTKEPYSGTKGFKDASRDSEKIRAWWRKNPKANIGLACSDLLVLDVDPRNGGSESLEKFCEENGLLPFTPSSVTGDSGAHYFFANPDGIRSGRLHGYPGLEVKGEGGYVVVAPSLHPSGRHYRWHVSPEEKPLAQAPRALIDLVGGRTTTPRERDGLSGLPVGKRSLLALRDGLPAPEGGSTQREIAVAIARNFYEAGREPNELRVLMAQVLDHEDSSLDPSRPWTEEDAEAIVSSVVRSSAPIKLGNSKRSALLERLTPVDLSQYEVKPPEWLIEGLFLKGKYHQVVGAAGSGKSLLTLGLIVTEAFPNRIRVAYIDEENGSDEIKRRLSMLGASPEDLRDLFLYLPNVSPTMQEAGEVVALIADLDPGLVVFDPLADLLDAAGLDENSNPDATRWVKAFAEPLAHDHGFATVALDHSGHTEKDRSRGASSKVAKADATWLIEVEREFDLETSGQVKLKRGQKNRQGMLPESHVFQIGGDGKGGTAFRRLGQQAAKEDKERQAKEDNDLRKATEKILQPLGEDGLSQNKLVEAVRSAGFKKRPKFLHDKFKEYADGASSRINLRSGSGRITYFIPPKGGRK